MGSIVRAMFFPLDLTISCVESLQTDRHSSFPVWCFRRTVNHIFIKDCAIVVPHRLPCSEILRRENAYYYWRLLDCRWNSLSHRSSQIFEQAEDSDQKYLSSPGTFPSILSTECAAPSRAGPYHSTTKKWSDLPQEKTIERLGPFGVFQAFFEKALRATVQSLRYSIAAISTSAFSTFLESLFIFCFANFSSRGSIIFSRHSLLLSQPETWNASAPSGRLRWQPLSLCMGPVRMHQSWPTLWGCAASLALALAQAEAWADV